MERINLMEEFFESSPTIASPQDKLLARDFDDWFKEKLKDFEFASKFLIIYLAKNHHPQTKVIVSCETAELMKGIDYAYLNKTENKNSNLCNYPELEEEVRLPNGAVIVNEEFKSLFSWGTKVIGYPNYYIVSKEEFYKLKI